MPLRRDHPGTTGCFTADRHGGHDRSIQPGSSGQFLMGVFDEWVPARCRNGLRADVDVTLGAHVGQYTRIFTRPPAANAL